MTGTKMTRHWKVRDQIDIIERLITKLTYDVKNRNHLLSMPGLRMARKPSGLRSTNHHGDALEHARARWRLLSMMVWFARSFRCSLSWWRKVGLPLEVWQESWPNFRWLPKISEIATNHWVFLRGDWSLVFCWFYYQS